MAWFIGGTLVTLLGWRRGGFLGTLLAIAGGAMTWRGASDTPFTGDNSMLAAGLGKLQSSLPAVRTVKVKQSVTIAKPREDVWRVVRDFAGFPRWARHVVSVTPVGDGRSRWVVRGPLGAQLEWDSEIVAEVPNERVSWQSVTGADIRNAGVLHLRDTPGGRGTDLDLQMVYDAPAGLLGEIVAKLLGEEPDIQADEDLQRLKQLVETGALPPAESSPPTGQLASFAAAPAATGGSVETRAGSTATGSGGGHQNSGGKRPA